MRARACLCASSLRRWPPQAASYPADEAASLESLKFRASSASDCFLLVERAGELVGFVCGTRAPDGPLTHQSMSEHTPNGAALCIHSVCVHPDKRRERIGTKVLEAYVATQRAAAAQGSGVATLRLLCKEHLQQFYASAGFELVGRSEVVHGTDTWYEMIITL